MRDLKTILSEQHRLRTTKEPVIDALVTELLRVAEELCVARDRLDTCQRLASEGRSVDDAALDHFEPDADILKERLERHQSLFEDIFERLGDVATT